MTTLHPSFITPRYNGHSFADIPTTIPYWLSGDGAPTLAPDVLGEYTQQYDKVVLFFIDSLGWQHIQRHREMNPFLKYIDQNGRIAQITSQFPSTTSAHATCIHTALPVGQSGIYEWQYYEPQLDAVIVPLLFSYAGESERDTLEATGIDPQQLYPRSTLYEPLTQRGIQSFLFQVQGIAFSTYSNIVGRGATTFRYRTLSEALVNMVEAIESQPAPSYFFVYFDRIDTLSHDYGPDSPQTYAEIVTTLWIIEQWFWRALRGKSKRTLFVMTADHGQMRTDPKTAVYLNRDRRVSDVVRLLRTNQRGEILVPGGSPRDVFLYVRDEALDDAHGFLSERLRDYADVVKTSELLKQDYFGKLPVCAELLGRLGNLTILPHPEQSVWWYEKDRFEQKYYGHHGGLTPQEMEIPLALLDLSA